MKTITTAVFAALALASVPLTTAEAQSLSPAKQEQLRENVMQADADQDGALNRVEFETLINLNADDGIGRAAMIKRTRRYGMAFGRLDTNGDGFVTVQEMQALAEEARG